MAALKVQLQERTAQFEAERRCVRRQQARSEEQEALWRLAAEASVAEQRVRSRAKLKRKLPVAWEKGFAAGKAEDRLERERDPGQALRDHVLDRRGPDSDEGSAAVWGAALDSAR